MPRYMLTVEYDGRPFVGWQRQTNGPSVQAALEDAIAAFCGEAVRVQGSGRTDTGVHARGQVVHCDLTRDWPAATVRDALNHHLRPAPVAVLACRHAGPEFDARFSAIRRHYLYRIVNRTAPLALEAGLAWQVRRPLDLAAMRAGAAHLVGRHDFTSFRASQCQAKSPLKTLDRFDLARDGDQILATVEARSFLHHQVRNMIGTLRLVGEGRWAPDDVARALAARNRAAAGPTAPPDGLYLMRIDYPPEAYPAPAMGAA